jgi:hypothetical protein
MNSRQVRLLKVLSEREKVFVKDLRPLIGALNPAQVAFTLRKKGWTIQTGFISMLDRDGSLCHPGYYWLDSKERERAREVLERASGAVAAAPSADVENSGSPTSENDHSKGGEI